MSGLCKAKRFLEARTEHHVVVSLRGAELLQCTTSRFPGYKLECVKWLQDTRGRQWPLDNDIIPALSAMGFDGHSEGILQNLLLVQVLLPILYRIKGIGWHNGAPCHLPHTVQATQVMMLHTYAMIDLDQQMLCCCTAESVLSRTSGFKHAKRGAHYWPFVCQPMLFKPAVELVSP